MNANSQPMAPGLKAKPAQALRIICGGGALALLAACNTTGGNSFDWDLRRGDGILATSEAVQQATERRPTPDNRGVISYPGYQVAVARRGDTVNSIAARVGLNGDELARYNAVIPTDPLREGEIVALPRRVAAAPANTGGFMSSPAPYAAPPTATASSNPINTGTVSSGPIATTSLDAPGTATPPATTKPKVSNEPVRHHVRRGESAFTIARSYNVSAKSLAEWNGLNANMDVREGQYLIIPVASATPPARNTPAVTAPGQGSATPTPPSASKPLPAEKPAPAATKPKETPASPNLQSQRTAASGAKMAMPVQGSIIRPYAKGKNEGIDIAAAAGTSVKAAADGTVAAITKDTAQTPIIVIRHANNLLTVYAGVDSITVKKGDSVKRGQSIAKIRAANPSFLHFEVRKGVESSDPVAYLQ